MTNERVAIARSFATADGDEDSSRFRDHLTRNIAAAYRLAAVILGNPQDGEDAAQDAIERAWRARTSLRDPDRFDAWFQRIVVNTCRDRARRGRSRAAIATFTSPERIAIYGESTATDPYDSTAARDALGQAFARLNIDQRVVVVLRFYLDLEIEEIARRMGARPGTIKSRLHRALATMRSAWEAGE